MKENFSDIEFTNEEIVKFLNQRSKGLSNINEFLAELVKNGYLITKNDPKDARKTIYKLAEIPEIKGHLTKDKLISLMKGGADLIRLRVDYRVLLILLFYKALSDNYNKRVNEYIKKEGLEPEDAYHLVNIEYYTLYDEVQHELFNWEETVKDKVRIVSNFVKSLNQLSDQNEKLSDLKILIEKLGFNSLLNNEDSFHIFLDIVDLFSQVDLTEVGFDVIGASYEWILSYFASKNIKEGELYTPVEVIKLMIGVLDIKKDSDVLDPASGSCTMLWESYNYVSETYQDGKTLRLIAQEYNDITAILGKLHLLLYDVYNFTVYTGDSLTNPKFDEADYVLSNPPWNQMGYDERKLSREDLKAIYSYGSPSKQSADWAWVQLMLNKTRKKIAVVLDSGALFRGGKEQAIRKQIIEEGLLDTVILFPEKLFYNTMAPGIILVFDKEKPENRKNKVFFVNMSKTSIKHPEIRKLNSLSREQIEDTAKICINHKNKEYFSREVNISEIRENDYSLSVPLYVQPKEDNEDIDLEEEIKGIEQDSDNEIELSKKVNSHLKKILEIIKHEK